MCGGTTDRPELLQEQIAELSGDVEGEIDFDALVATAGAWAKHRVERGGTLPGPISHVYSANLCM